MQKINKLGPTETAENVEQMMFTNAMVNKSSTSNSINISKRRVTEKEQLSCIYYRNSYRKKQNLQFYSEMK